MDLFFPKLMDIKSFVRLKIYQDGGLGKIADFMGVPREGTMHQAGSDSMLTIQTFFAMFNCMLKEKDRQEYKEIFDEFNQDVYGFSNDQAYRNLALSFTNEPVKNN
jgi:CCR4-NOT transcription complex subunit 7/8